MRPVLKRSLPVLLCLIIACKSAELVSYRTIGTVVHSVDLAMNGWGDYVRAHRGDPALPPKEAQVRKAYETYQQAITVAIAVQHLGTGDLPSQAIVDAAKALLELIGKLRS